MFFYDCVMLSSYLLGNQICTNYKTRFGQQKNASILRWCFFPMVQNKKFGERILETTSAEVPGSVLCPVQASSYVQIVCFEEQYPLPNEKCIFYKDLQAKLGIHKIGLNPFVITHLSLGVFF